MLSKSAACTAAAILFPQTYFEMVRVGIGQYGLWPSKETYLSALKEGKDASQGVAYLDDGTITTAMRARKKL